MPELPEVTTIVKGLQHKIIGFRIKSVWTDYKKNAKNLNLLKGQVIKKVTRRGKNILIYLSQDYILLIHQKISGHLLLGRWILENGVWVPMQNNAISLDRVNNYIHFMITFDNGEMLALSDLRKFAKIIVGKKQDIESLKELVSLGKDPFDKTFTKTWLIKKIEHNTRSIKQVLMDQTIIAGIGNIYSDEILFDAQISPLRKANSLTGAEIEKIYKSIKKILKLAIRYKGTSVSDFRDIYGYPGEFSKMLKVYNKKSGKCVKCHSDIKTIKINGRTAHYCPKCQK